MSNKKFSWKNTVLITMLLVWLCSMAVFAASNDNSLSSLGITTEGVTVSPEFVYSTWTYDVIVPAGTQKLELDPKPSNENAWIVDVLGTELIDGQSTVQIIVSAESGDRFTYTLNVKADASAGTAAVPETETETETEEETETESETEDPRYIKVDRNSLEAAEKTISALKAEGKDYRDRLGIMTYILYGLIGFAVILLFVVINLILKKKDLKKELEHYTAYGQSEEYYPQNQRYEQQGYDQQAYGVYEQQGYDQQAYDEHEQQGYDQQAYGEYEQQGYDRQAYDEYEQQGYDQQAYDEYEQQGYDQQAYDEYEQQGYDQQAYEESVKKKKIKEKKEKKQKVQNKEPEVSVQDDPATVPKPSRARKQSRKMPEYEQPQIEERKYQEKNRKSTDKVEVTMIDL